MSNVDKRVVEMQFNNKQFEKDMATTVKSLKNFEKSLEFKNSSKGLDNAAKGISNFESKVNKMDLSKFESSVEGISSRLSTMGAIAFTTIQNLATDAYNLVKSKFASIWDTVMSKGMSRALNLEQANFQLMGLLKNEKEVAKVMEDVDYAVSGTAYGLDEAAKVASQLAASNVTSGEYMKAALRGISGVAAMTSSSYEEIGNVFTRVAGQGRVMATDLNSVAARGLNAAATLADFLGTTEAEVRELVSAGAIDFKTFAMAMDDAFGEHAKEANKTFSGAMQNVKAALGRIGAGFKQPYIKFMRPVLVQLIQNINAIKDSMAPLFETVSFIYEKLSNFFVSVLKNFVEFRKEGNKEVATISSLKDAFQKFHDFVIGNWNKAAKIINGFTKAILSLFSILKPVVGIVSIILSNFIEGLLSLSDTMDSVSKNGGGLIGFFTTIKNVLESLRAGIAKSSSSIKLIFASIFGIINDVLSIFFKITSLIFGSFNNLTDNGTVFYNLISVILNVIASGLKVIKKVTGFISKIIELIYPLIKAITSLTTKIGGLIASISVSIFSKILNRITTFINKIFDLNISIGSITETFKGFGSFLETKFKNIIQIAANSVEWFGSIIDSMSGGFLYSGDSAEESGNKIVIYKNKIKESSKEIAESIKTSGLLGTVWQKVTDTFKSIFEKVDSIRKVIIDRIKNSEILKAVVETVQKFALKIRDGLSHVFESLSTKGPTFTIFDWLKGLIRAVADLVKSLITNFEPAKQSLLEFFGANNILDLLQRFVSMYVSMNLGNALSSFVRVLQNFVTGVAGPFQIITKNFRARTATALRSFTRSVLELAISIFLISRIPIETLIPTVSILTGFLIVVIGCLVALNKLLKDCQTANKNILMLSVLLIGFGKAIRGIVTPLSLMILVIDRVKPESVYLAVKVVGAISAFLAAFIILFAKFAKSKMTPTQVLSFSALIKVIGSAIKNISLVVGILSLFDRRKLNNATDKVKELIGLFGIFTILFSGINNKMTPTQVLSFSLLINTFKSAIMGIALVVGILSLFDDYKLNNATDRVEELIGLFGVFSILFTGAIRNLKPSQILSFSLMIDSLKSAIMGIALVIGILSLLNPAKLQTSLIIVTLASSILAGLTLLTKTINGANAQKAAKGILLIATSIAIFGMTIKQLSKIDMLTLITTSATLITSILLLGTVLVGLSVFAVKLNILSTAMVGFGASAALFGAGVYLIAKAVKMMTDLGPSAIKMMTDMITALVANAPKWVVMFITAFIDAISGMLPAIAKSLIDSIVTIIQIMTQSAGTIISSVVNFFKNIITSLTAYKDAFDIKDLFWAINVVALIAGLIYILQVIASDMKSALNGIALMGIVLGAIVGAIMVLNKFTDVDKTIETIKGLALSILSLAGVFLAIGGVITLMTAVTGGNEAKTFKMLGVGILAFLALIIGLVASFWIIGGIINLIGESALEAINRAVKVISLIGKALGSFMGNIVTSFASLVKDSDTSIPMLLTLVPLILALEPLILILPILTAFIIAIGALMNALDENFGGSGTTFLQKAIEVLPLIGEAIGGFLGSLVGAAAKFAAEGLAKSLVTFADVLSGFFEKLQPFLDGLKSIGMDTLKASTLLTGILLEMCAVELATTIVNFLSLFTGGFSMVKLAEDLAKMGPYLVKFSSCLKKGKFNAQLANAAAMCSLTMAKALSSLPRDGGFWSLLAGNRISMDKLGEEAEGLGEAMSKFADSVNTISKEKSDKVKILLPLVHDLIEVANAMPKENGFWQLLIGNLKDMDNFGTELSGLGTSLVEFANSVDNISEEQSKKIDSILPLIKSMIEVANAMPKENGFWQTIVGNLKGLDDFGTELSILGVGLDALARNVGHINENQMKNLENIMPLIIDLTDIANDMVDKGINMISIFGAFSFGETKGLDEFGKELGALGEGISSFAAETSDISANNIESAKPAISLLKTLAEVGKTVADTDANPINKFINLISGVNLESFASHFPNVGKFIKTFAETTADLPDMTNTAKAAEAVKNIADAFKAASDINEESGFENFFNMVSKFVETDNDTGNKLSDFINLFGADNAAVQKTFKRSEAVGKVLQNIANAFNDLKISDINYDDIMDFFISGLSKFIQNGKHLVIQFLSFADAKKLADNSEYVKKMITNINAALKEMIGINTYEVKKFVECCAFIAAQQEYEYAKGYTDETLKKIANLLGEDNSAAQNAYKRVQAVGEAIVALASSISNIDSIDTQKVKDLVSAIEEIASPSDGFKWNVLISSTSPFIQEDFGKAVTNIKTLADGVSNISDVDKESVEDLKNAVNSIAEMSITAILEDFDTRSKEVINKASLLIKNIGVAFANQKIFVVNQVKAIMNESSRQLNAYTRVDSRNPGSFYVAGLQSVNGYVKGISQNLYKAVDAGRKIGKSALQGTQFSLDVNSPSKEYGKLAYFGVLGLVNEFAACSDMVFKSGQDLGNSAMNGTKSIIANLDSAINSDMNLQPVISPVLDLSEVSSQAGLIGGMLNAGTSYRIAGATSSLINQNNVNRARTKINQNRSPDVVEAVNALNSRMDSLEQAIINRPIVMDGEKVTKQIAPSMDRALGRRKYYSGRGN